MKFIPPILILTLTLWAGAYLSAQTKAEQVETYLGAYRYRNDKPLGTVKFIFQRAVLTREGNGRKTYDFLLTRYPGFNNEDNAGKLLAVQVVHGGKEATIFAEPAVKGSKRGAASTPYATDPPPPTKSAPVKPRRKTQNQAKAVPAQLVNESPESQPAVDLVPVEPSDPMRAPDPGKPNPGGGGGISMPDSATIVQNLDEAKQTVTGWKARLWQTVQPVWEFVMWTFNSIIVLLICIGGLFRYVAKTAASESMVSPKGRVVTGRWIASAHQNAAGMLLIVTWIIAIVFLIDAFMWLIYLDLPIWLLVVIWFPILWLAEKITSWIVPNIPISNT